MTIQPLYALPGVCKSDSAFAASVQGGYTKEGAAMGRYTAMEGARFVAGYPEKIMGCNYALGTAITGTPRGLRDWRDNSSNVYLGIGTSKKLYYFQTGAVTDITPFRVIQTGTLTNAFVVTNSSSTVTVTHGTHGLLTNDYVQLVANTAVGGITPAGVFNPITVTGTNNYTFVNPTAATANGTGGGNITYSYYRTTLGTNPYATTTASPTVKVTHTAHGAITGDFVEIAGGTAVAGLTLAGEYSLTVVDANSYNITASSNANATTTGGGTPNVQYDISIGTTDATTSYGYSTGSYSGAQGYGQNSSIGVITPPRVWSLHSYGQQLLSTYYGGTIYIWDPVIAGRSYPLYGAPATVNWMFVTPERFVFALAPNSNPMQVSWPDQSDYTAWAVTATNTANSGRTLQNGSYLIGGISVRDGVSMIFSNKAAFVFNYSGDNFVYTTQTAGDGCGLAGPLAVNVIGGVAYWMGTSELWSWNGSVQPMDSDDIRDYVFQNINLTQSYKFVCGTNIAKKEVWFFYVSAASTEIDSYIIRHIDQSCWSVGTVIKRTSWVDRGLFQNPMATDAAGFIYNQESGNDLVGAALKSSITFSPVSIGKGQLNQDVFAFIPDLERQNGNISLNVNTQQYPQDTATVYGPYTITSNDTTPRIDLRVGGKLIGYQITSNVIGGDWRLGLPTIELQQAGARR